MLELILKQKEIICSRHRNDIFSGMPCGMQDLLIEVQTVHTNLILLTFTTGTDLGLMQKSFNDPKDYKTLLSLKQMSLKTKNKTKINFHTHNIKNDKS